MGAILFDLYMAHRYDRERAREMGLMSAMNRLAECARDADIRDGRQSWRDPADVIADNPWLRSRTMVKPR